MRWLKLLLMVPALLGTALAAMFIAFPDAGWRADWRLPVAAFALLSGAWVAVSLLLHRDPVKWTPERQLEHLCTMVNQDNRWLASNDIASALTNRYLLALASNWYTHSFEDTPKLRKRLGLEPHYKPAAPEPEPEVPPQFDTAEAHHVRNFMLRTAAHAIRETTSREQALDILEGLIKP